MKSVKDFFNCIKRLSDDDYDRLKIAMNLFDKQRCYKFPKLTEEDKNYCNENIAYNSVLFLINKYKVSFTEGFYLYDMVIHKIQW